MTMCSEMAHARPKPSYVDVPRPSSSMMISDEGVAAAAGENVSLSPVAGALGGGAGEKREREEGEGAEEEDAARGAARARQFLADFAALPLPEMSPADAVRRVQQMKKELESDAGDSKWLQGILA